MNLKEKVIEITWLTDLHFACNSPLMFYSQYQYDALNSKKAAFFLIIIPGILMLPVNQFFCKVQFCINIVNYIVNSWLHKVIWNNSFIIIRITINIHTVMH